MLEVWFWQRMVSPHMIGLARALTRLNVKVTYVAEVMISSQRREQGWLEPEVPGVQLILARDRRSVGKLVARAGIGCTHVCQGIRGNGLVGVAQKALASRGLNYFVVMESVMDSGWRGMFKRFEYSRILRSKQDSIAAVLAIGYLTPSWVVRRGIPAGKVFPFAYFLDKSAPPEGTGDSAGPVRFIFVGQFISIKRLDWLIEGLAAIGSREFELLVIGSGPLEHVLQQRATDILGERLTWIGRLPSDEVRGYIAEADCLVLPSSYDGWGAVVSEALISGTPVICSNACGSAGVVENSGVGGVFDADDFGGLQALLENTVAAGRVAGEKRRQLRDWSEAITSEAGAQYLIDIVSSGRIETDRIAPPWSCRGE